MMDPLSFGIWILNSQFVEIADAVIMLEASNRDPCSFITAGEKSIRVWRVDLKNRKLLPEDCNLGEH